MEAVPFAVGPAHSRRRRAGYTKVISADVPSQVHAAGGICEGRHRGDQRFCVGPLVVEACEGLQLCTLCSWVATLLGQIVADGCARYPAHDVGDPRAR